MRGKPTPIALLDRWPLPQDLCAAPTSLVRAAVAKASRNQYGQERIDRLLDSASLSVGLIEGAEVRRQEIHRLFRRRELVRRQIADIEASLMAGIDDCPPAKALLTIPEVGTVCAATFISELGTPEDFESPRQVLKLAGINLVVKESGTFVGQPKGSKRGRPELRRQLFLLAGRWCRRRGLYRAYFESMIRRNGEHKTKAVFAVARKLVPLLLRVAQTQEPFNRDAWLAHRAAVA